MEIKKQARSSNDIPAGAGVCHIAGLQTVFQKVIFMDKKINIGKWEAVTILINMINVKIFLNFPRKMAEEAGNAGWLLTIYICILAFAGFFIIAKLYKPFEDKDLLDIGGHIGGKIGKIAVGLVLLALLAFTVSLNLRILAEEMKTVALTNSPISYVSAFLIICMVIGAYLGIEALARYHAIIVPIIAAGYLIIISGVIPYIDISNLVPIFGKGPYNIFVDGMLNIGVFTELIILFLLTPYLKTHKRLTSTGFTALGFSAFFMILAVIVYLSVIPFPQAEQKVLPIFHLARLINFGRLFQRVESVFVFTWATAGIMYVTVGLYFIADIFKKTFSLKYHKPLVFPFAAILFSISLLPESFVQSTLMNSEIVQEWGWIITFAMTIILLLTGRFIKRKPAKTSGKTLK